MASNDDTSIIVNGYEWIDVTNQTTSCTIVARMDEIIRAGGDPYKVRQIDCTHNEER